jgi:hypothetical protein
MNDVKKLSLAISIVMMLVMLIPTTVHAAGVGTGVTLTGGGGDKPLVLAKWETPDASPGKVVPPTQIAPPVSYQGTAPIQFWAVVYNNPINGVSQVAVEVYHPALPLLGAAPGAANSWKFQVILTPFNSALADGTISPDEAQAALDQYTAALAAGLVTAHATPYPNNETIPQMLAQGQAYLWYGAYVMEYHQPAGIYKVDCWAKNQAGMDAANDVINYFEYVAVTAFEVDFASVNYGNLNAKGDGSADGVVSGDMIFGNVGGGPTLRNIGNTWFQLQIQQDDMGFNVSQPGNVWNVTFDARIGSLLEYPVGGGTNTIFDPAFFKGPTSPDAAKWTTLPGIIHLCNTWKIDLSIHVVKFTGSAYSGSIWFKALTFPFDGLQIDNPGGS